MTDSQEYYWDLSVAVVIECAVASGGKWNLGGVVGGTGGMDDCVCVWGGGGMQKRSGAALIALRE